MGVISQAWEMSEGVSPLGHKAWTASKNTGILYAIFTKNASKIFKVFAILPRPAAVSCIFSA